MPLIPAMALVAALLAAPLAWAQFGLPGAGHPPADGGDELVTMAIVSRGDRLVPGSQTELGVLFEIERGWHIYWQGHNDTGFPTQLDIELPEGIEAAGPIRWPAPQRYVQPGNILDHIYEGRVLAILPVRVAEDAVGLGSVKVRAGANWLVCMEACLPGSADAEANFTITHPAAEAGPGEHEELFGETRLRLPRPVAANDPVRVAWKDAATLEIRGPEGSELLFFPADDGARIADRIEACVGRERLQLSVAQRDAASDAPPRAVRGVLEVRPAPTEATPDPRPVFFEIEQPPFAAAVPDADGG